VRAAEVEPRTVKWDGTGGTPTRYVVSMNLHRRQLTPSQLAMVAAELEPHFKAEAEARAAEGRKKGAEARHRDPASAPRGAEAATERRAIDDAAAAAGASPRSAQRAKAVMEADPALAAEVRAGSKTVKQAEREVRERKQASAPAPAPAPTPQAPVPSAAEVRRALISLSSAVSAVQRDYLALLDNPSISESHKQTVRSAFVPAVSRGFR
jgi:hypothetical protein